MSSSTGVSAPFLPHVWQSCLAHTVCSLLREVYHWMEEYVLQFHLWLVYAKSKADMM